MAKAAAREEEGSGKETVVEGRHSASEEHGPQRTRRENRESSGANRRRNASKGDPCRL